MVGKLELSEGEKGIKIKLVLLAFILFVVFLIGIFWLVTTPGQTVGLTLAFAAGLSMIVLPCTLPLAFIIIPLSMGKGYKKGFFMALLFGLGLTLTIMLYGVTIALIGKMLGMDKATMLMWLIGGGAAYLFGLSELNLLKFRIPALKKATPEWVQKRGDYLKAFFLGLFLGNAGVGCPNPAFYVLLAYIASTGSILYGGSLGFIHGLGRAVPLIFLSILAIVGINATSSLVKHKIKVTNVMGWSLVIIGAFILVNGIPGGHVWYEETVVHQGWNKLVMGAGGEGLGEIMEEQEEHIEGDEHEPEEHDEGSILPRHEHETLPIKSASLILTILILIPVGWHYIKKQKGEAL